jgi:hypothetical protein
MPDACGSWSGTDEIGWILLWIFVAALLLFIYTVVRLTASYSAYGR